PRLAAGRPGGGGDLAAHALDRDGARRRARPRGHGDARRDPAARRGRRLMAADPDCLFCKIVAGEVPATRVHEDERTIAIMDINPATRGHLLVIPREHAQDLLSVDADDLSACARAAQLLATRVSERLGADGV